MANEHITEQDMRRPVLLVVDCPENRERYGIKHTSGGWTTSLSLDEARNHGVPAVVLFVTEAEMGL